jgi:hypothetical protein
MDVTVNQAKGLTFNDDKSLPIMRLYKSDDKGKRSHSSAGYYFQVGQDETEIMKKWLI